MAQAWCKSLGRKDGAPEAPEKEEYQKEQQDNHNIDWDDMAMLASMGPEDASAYWHAEDHFFTYLKWSLDIMWDMAQSVSKESITKARVKQVQAGEKQKKMKESTLDNKKIKATSELNIAVIESKRVLFSKFFESQNNCKKVTLIASKLMIWKPEDLQKLFHEISKIEEINKIPSSALEMTTMWSLSVDNVLRFISIKGKSPSMTKKQKPKASTTSADIIPTPQSHTKIETKTNGTACGGLGAGACAGKAECVWCGSRQTCMARELGATCEECTLFDMSSEECARRSGCSWCPSQAACQPASKSGGCVACAALDSGHCDQSSFCSWCPASRRCQGLSDTCARCESQGDAAQCGRLAGCGWCAAGGACTEAGANCTACAGLRQRDVCGSDTACAWCETRGLCVGRQGGQCPACSALARGACTAGACQWCAASLSCVDASNATQCEAV
eukprot:m51a1_g11377 hypothetical protein (446) ;mRNA; r:16056-41959